VGPWNVFVPSAISAGILTFACIGIHSAAGLYTYCVLYGLCSGNLTLVEYNLFQAPSSPCWDRVVHRSVRI
jgi:hypothetical protein